MIQTSFSGVMVAKENSWSQSSIRPGDDSDNVLSAEDISGMPNKSQSSIRPGDDSDVHDSRGAGPQAEVSQSSIRPGDDSDTMVNEIRTPEGWKLESQSSIRPGDDSDISGGRDNGKYTTSLSQSSIRPGDDSDSRETQRRNPAKNCRNPVFALEMIQTRRAGAACAILTWVSRNPVFALEMIQTFDRPAPVSI